MLTPIATGVGAFGFFYAAALVARRIPVLETAISRVLVFADEGDDRLVLLTTLANGVAEELFFRGALYAALGDSTSGRRVDRGLPLATSTTRNPALVLAATVDGLAVRPAAARLRRDPGAHDHPPHVVDPDAALPAAAGPSLI